MGREQVIENWMVRSEQCTRRGQYPFRDGVITLLELEIAIWRNHPKALFALMRMNPIRQSVEYVLGSPEFPSEN